jgi:uncharacterized membrane protein YkoI
MFKSTVSALGTMTIAGKIAACTVVAATLSATPWAWVQAASPIVPMGALAHATTELERESGGKVLEIRLVDEEGDPSFEAALKVDDAIHYMRIAPVADTVTEITVRELPAWLADYRLEAYMTSIDKAHVPLPEAVDQVERKAMAPAVAAGIAKPLSGSNAVLAYYVETMLGKKQEIHAIDARSGRIIANPEAVYEPRTPLKLLSR